MRDEPFVSIALEVAGGIGPVTSAALKYVKSIRLAQDPDVVPTPPDLLVATLGHCVRFIIHTSVHSAAMREQYILQQSVKEIFWSLRVVQPLLSATGSVDSILRPSLSSSFEYLAFLLHHADDTVSAVYQALRSHALETAVHIGPLGPGVEATQMNRVHMGFLEIFDLYLVHDKILTYVHKHLRAWSNALGPIMRQDTTLWKHWFIIERTTRSYVKLKSSEERMRRPSPDKKSWVLRVSLRCFVTTDLLTYR